MAVPKTNRRSEENLQVTENGGTFAPAVDEYDPAGKGRYVSPMVDYGFKMIFEKEDILREFLNDLLSPPTPIKEVHYLMRGMTPPSRKERKAEYDHAISFPGRDACIQATCYSC